MATAAAPADLDVLAQERDRAERQLNAVRAIVLALLALAALAYGAQLSAALNIVNAALLVPMLAWTAAQYALLYRRSMLPAWLSITNAIVDVTAVTLVIGGYGAFAAPSLALKSPMVLAYVVMLAARPIASSVRMTAAVGLLVAAEYVALDVFFIFSRHVALRDPVGASLGPGVSLLDEGAKVVLLLTGAGIATYATHAQERLARQYSAAGVERERLQQRLAASRLDSLKQQLQPHFLFNALNAITALVDTDPAAAQRMIAGLGELMRFSLDAGGDHEIPLERELAVLAHYVAIQRVRFEDRLTVAIRVEGEIGDALVPAMLLQPLVENSIKHGIGQRAAAGRIEIRAWRDGDHLALVVADDGPGLGASTASPVEHIGLGNTRARLSYLYGAHHSFRVESPPPGGFVVSMRLPYRSGARVPDATPALAAS